MFCCICLPPTNASHEKRRADLAGAEMMYKKAGAVDPFHANSIYNYAVLLDSSLKQQEVSLRYDTAAVSC